MSNEVSSGRVWVWYDASLHPTSLTNLFDYTPKGPMRAMMRELFRDKELKTRRWKEQQKEEQKEKERRDRRERKMKRRREKESGAKRQEKQQGGQQQATRDAGKQREANERSGSKVGERIRPRMTAPLLSPFGKVGVYKLFTLISSLVTHRIIVSYFAFFHLTLLRA